MNACEVFTLDIFVRKFRVSVLIQHICYIIYNIVLKPSHCKSSMHYYDCYYYYYLPKPKWERVQNSKIFSRYTKKMVRNLKVEETFTCVCMCTLKFIMFTKVICDNPDHIKSVVWYGTVFKGITWKLNFIMAWDIS